VDGVLRGPTLLRWSSPWSTASLPDPLGPADDDAAAQAARSDDVFSKDLSNTF
jgi:hypothetical protein